MGAENRRSLPRCDEGTSIRAGETGRNEGCVHWEQTAEEPGRCLGQLLWNMASCHDVGLPVLPKLMQPVTSAVP